MDIRFENSHENKTHFLGALLKGSTFFLFLGRGIQHIFWDTPYRTFFWNQEFLEGFVTSVLGISWNSFVTGPELSLFLKTLNFSIGSLLLLGSILILKEGFLKPALKNILILSFFQMFAMGLFKFYGKSFQVAILLEYAIQTLLPLLYFLYNFSIIRREKVLQLGLIATSLTFIGHGLYAVGFYPVPGNFLEMVIGFFPLNQDQALWFLRLMGSIDIWAGLLILFNSPLRRSALIFTIFWGFTTAFARTICYFDPAFPMESLFQWVPQTLFRLPHGLIPLFCYFSLFPGTREKEYEGEPEIQPLS